MEKRRIMKRHAPQHRDSLFGYAAAFAAIIVALLVAAALASRADASD